LLSPFSLLNPQQSVIVNLTKYTSAVWNISGHFTPHNIFVLFLWLKFMACSILWSMQMACIDPIVTVTNFITVSWLEATALFMFYDLWLKQICLVGLEGLLLTVTICLAVLQCVNVMVTVLAMVTIHQCAHPVRILLLVRTHISHYHHCL